MIYSADVHRDRALIDIERAIQSAISADMTAADFIQCTWQMWTNVLDEHQKLADSTFRDALRRKP